MFHVLILMLFTCIFLGRMKTSDISPSYCGLSSIGIAAVAEQWPNSFIVAFVRDPVSRAISGVMRSRTFAHLGGQNETIPGTWQEAMVLNGPFSRLQNNYHLNIVRRRRHFPETNCILNSDAIEHNPAASLIGLIEHLGMQWVSEPSNDELGKKVNRSSDIDISVGADNELHLIKYWLSRDLLKSIPPAVVHGWKKKWLERGRSVEPFASLQRARAIDLALSGLDLPYRLARQLRGALHAKFIRRALRA